MGLSVLSHYLIIFLAFLSGIHVGLTENVEYREKYFISWDDLEVNEYRGSLNRDSYNESRVIVVDQNGGGDSFTVQQAVNMVPQYNNERVKILIHPGIYREKVFVPSTKPYISFIGDEKNASNTVISWNNKASDKDSNGNDLGTYRSSSVTVESDYFCASGITFENTVMAVPGGEGNQAVALRIAGDKAMFYRVRVLGDQDTLLDESGTHYFYQCYIQGSVDFIFGRAKSFYQSCEIRSTAKNYGAIAAHHRNTADEDTGFSFVNCKIIGTGRIYLGRAWGNYSRAVYSFSYMDDIILPQGWSDWNFPSRQRTTVFGEYKCRGRGADARGRVPWMKNFSYEEVRPFLDLTFIQADQWLKL